MLKKKSIVKFQSNAETYVALYNNVRYTKSDIGLQSNIIPLQTCVF